VGISQKNQRAAKHICLRFALGARGDVLDQPDLALAMRTIILDILKDFFRGTHGSVVLQRNRYAGSTGRRILSTAARDVDEGRVELNLPQFIFQARERP